MVRYWLWRETFNGIPKAREIDADGCFFEGGLCKFVSLRNPVEGVVVAVVPQDELSKVQCGTWFTGDDATVGLNLSDPGKTLAIIRLKRDERRD